MEVQDELHLLKKELHSIKNNEEDLKHLLNVNHLDGLLEKIDYVD